MNRRQAKTASVSLAVLMTGLLGVGLETAVWANNHEDAPVRVTSPHITTIDGVPYVTLTPGQAPPPCGYIVVWAGTNTEQDTGDC